MKKYTWKFEISLTTTKTWVEDGFDPDEEQIKEVLKENLLTYSYDHEFTVTAKKIEAPDPKEIRKVQGYKD
jgi:hypothetical protein